MKLSTRLAARLAALALLMLPGAAPAQQHLPTPQPVEALALPTEAHPALWKIADADTTIYLFGTIHMLPSGLEWYSDALPEALAEADELVTELPDVPQDQITQAALKWGTLPAGKTLRAMLGPRERTRYEAALAALALPPAAFDRFQPWFAGMMIGVMSMQAAGFDPESGVEKQIEQRNNVLGHPRHGLETMDFQLSLFANLSPKSQKAFLIETIDQLPTLREDSAKMLEAWAVGDLDGLAKQARDEEEDPALIKALLTDRNLTWTKWLKARLDQPGTVFVAVGAGHLGGAGGVIDDLAREGIKAQRVQ